MGHIRRFARLAFRRCRLSGGSLAQRSTTGEAAAASGGSLAQRSTR
jgi:hypothetical protein